MKKKLLLCLILLFSCNFVFADESKCDKEELKRLKAQARSLEYVYTPYDENGAVKYKISIYNLTDDIVALVERDIFRLDFDEFKKDKTEDYYYRDNYDEGDRVTITVRGYTRDNCAFERLAMKTISLPYYNHFYNSKECQENPLFTYCKNEYESSRITEEKFTKELEKYLKKNAVVEENNDKNDNLIYYIIGAILFLIIIVILLIFIIKIIKKRKALDI